MRQAEQSPLFERFPQLLGRVPWMPLGEFPTRIDTVTVSGSDGAPRTILVKREDLSGAVYGGNKVRKLEFLLAEARRRGAGRLITVGAAGSHHALATATHGCAAGFDVSLVLFPQPFTSHVRDILLMDQALGAEIRWIRRIEMVPFAVWHTRLTYRRDAPFVIKPGGSDATGTLGWVGAGLELASQFQAGECPRPDIIHVAAGTLGTAAGLALGLAIAGIDVPVAATRITSRIITNERVLTRLVRGAATLLQSESDLPVERALAMIEIRHGQIGRGYGRGTDASGFASESFGAAGIRLEETYTAKAAAELLAGPEELPLFVHTLSSAEPLDRVDEDTAAALPEPVLEYLAQHAESIPD